MLERLETPWARMYHAFAYDRERFMQHYHKRSNVESTFSMIKGKFGDSAMSKSDTGQANEVLCKVPLLVQRGRLPKKSGFGGGNCAKPHGERRTKPSTRRCQLGRGGTR